MTIEKKNRLAWCRAIEKKPIGFNRKKTDWHDVGRKGGGQLSINGIKSYSVTSHKFVLGRTSVYMYGGNMEKGGDRTW